MNKHETDAQLRQRPSLSRALSLHSLAYLAHRGAPYLAAVITARILGAEDFGLFVTAASFYATILIVVDLGLGVAVTTRVAERHHEGAAAQLSTAVIACTFCFSLGLVASSALALAIEPISHLVLGDSDLASLLLPALLYIPCAALVFAGTSALQGMQRFGANAFNGLFGGSAYLLIAVLAALSGDPSVALWGAALGMCLRAVICIGILAALARPRDVTSKGIFPELRQLGRIALPAALAAFAFTPVITWMLATLLKQPDGPQEAGAFGITMQIFSLVMVIPSIITQFALPRLTSISGPSKHPRRRTAALAFAAVSAGAAVLVGLPLIVFAAPISHALGSDFYDYQSVLVIMMIAVMFSAPQGTLSNYLLAERKSWERVVTMYVWAAVAVTVFLRLPDKTAVSASQAFAFAWAAILAAQLLFFSTSQSRTRT